MYFYIGMTINIVLVSILIIWGIYEGIRALIYFITDKKYIRSLIAENINKKLVISDIDPGIPQLALILLVVLIMFIWPLVLLAGIITCVAFGGRALYRRINDKTQEP